jgi:acetyltransferase
MVVDHISHLFYAADTLSKQPRPKGPRLCVVTNAGGPGVLTSDALIEGGGQLANISPETLQALSAFLPSAWSHANPVDVLGDADSTRYAKTLEQVIKDPNNDGVLVILTPQAMTTPAETAKDLAVYHQVDGKPILASWMGGSSVQKGRELLSGAGIPNFPFPDTACRIFNYMWQYSANLKALYETPALPQGSDAPDRAAARTLLQKARSEGRTLLTEYESKKLLEAYGIPTVQTLLAGTADQAASMADSIGYPVVVKLNSTTLTHKTDVGGVRLHLENSSEVKKAFGEILDSITRLKGAQHFQGVTVQPMVKWEGYELILGSSLDPQIGPVLLFGSGGQLVEVYRDHALGLPPLNSTLARRMMEQTKVYKALGGVRGRKSVDLPALEQLMVRFSWLVAEQRWIKELDINPLLASPEGLVALDARVVLHEADMTEDKLPRLAIRPYPIEYVTPWTAADGAKITLRPIRPEDEPLIIKFHETLSEQSVYSRYFENMQWTSRTAHERLTRVCFVDYDRDVVLNAVQQTPSGEAIVGVGRLSRTRLQDEAEFSIIISDHWQKKGLGSEIMSLLLKFGKVEKIHRVVGYTLPENQSMRAICKKFGFKETPIEYNRIIALSLDL